MSNRAEPAVSAIETRDAIRRGDLTAEAAAAASIAAIGGRTQALHAFLHIDEAAP